MCENRRKQAIAQTTDTRHTTQPAIKNNKRAHPPPRRPQIRRTDTRSPPTPTRRSFITSPGGRHHIFANIPPQTLGHSIASTKYSGDIPRCHPRLPGTDSGQSGVPINPSSGDGFCNKTMTRAVPWVAATVILCANRDSRPIQGEPTNPSGTRFGRKPALWFSRCLTTRRPPCRT